jgi:formylmethanofuran dehydrogenase subunit E/predicted RNA-binding protein
VYVAEGDRETLLMKDVGWLETEGRSVALRDLSGREKKLRARLKYADLVGHRVVFESHAPVEQSLGGLMERATEFHGHLGPFLVFGVRAGVLAAQRLGFEGHFDVRVRAFTGTETPVSCVIDGLQVSTGATLGKGNVQVHPIRNGRPGMVFESGDRSLEVTLTDEALALTRGMDGDEAAERAARRALRMTDEELFEVEEPA